MSPLDYIARPLGEFLLFIYNTLAFHNYGLAIILFTIVIKLVLLPLTVKQYRSSAKMQEIQPLIQEVQKRYKNDKEKLNQEMMKVYQENNYNPAGGCLPMLVQMPILISLYWVIIQPLKFLLHKTPTQVTQLIAKATQLIGNTAPMGYQKEVSTLNYFYQHQDKLSQVSGLLSAKELINMKFLVFHLGEIPSYATNKLFGPEWQIYLPLIILPLIAAATTFISTKLTMPRNTQNNNQPAMGSSLTNSMMYIGPVMTLVFAFQIPASASLYWSVSYIFTIFQQMYINKHVIGKKNIPAVTAGKGGKAAITDGKAAGEGKAAITDGSGSNPVENKGNAENKNVENKKPNMGNMNKKGGGKGGNQPGKKKEGSKKK